MIMRKISLLTTGGTIASQPTANGLAPSLTPADLLRHIPGIEDLCQLETEELFSLDSTHIQPHHWQLMARRIYEKLPQTDGIVLCHGTDTMAYTAAALFTMLPGLDKPVILTGSQLPFDAAHTDARRNLQDAFRVCASGLFSGVFLVFDGTVISGSCAHKVHTRELHGFTSINFPEAGSVKNGSVLKNKDPRLPWNIPDPAGPQTPQLADTLDPNIFLLKLIPGLDSRILDHIQKLGYAGILIEAFGSGGIPGLDGHFLDGINRCTSQGIPVVVTTQCSQGPADLEIYEVGVRAAAAGAICGRDLSTEMLTVRLMWALGQTREPDQIREMLFPFAM